MNIEVTSVSKKAQKLSSAAAAIFVITQEDIRRSGVTSIPEALRMAPGVQVAHIDANKWAISARGFNGRFSNKLLVLMDGRTLYSPTFSGVFWEAQDTLLEDIDRIEVIRGPGATLWGSNAVNGVINIITKHTKETQGGLITAGVGTEEKGFGSVRYGASSGENTTWRLYGKYFNRDDSKRTDGSDASDQWDMLRGGFRMNHVDTPGRNAFTIQGDIYNGDIGERITTYSQTPPFSTTTDERNDMTGLNVLGRWDRKLSETSDFTLQFYYDYSEIDADYLGVKVNTYDIDFQHRFELGEKQEITWGLQYRYIRDDYDNTAFVGFDPAGQEYNNVSAFIQDEIVLLEQLRLTVGSKFEYNDYTQTELQPSARIMWNPREDNWFWSSVSRAVRTPSRGDRDINLIQNATASTANPPLTSRSIIVTGNDDFDSEKLIAYEAGYRTQPTDNLSLDLTAFFNDYDDLQTSKLESSVDLMLLQAVINTSPENKMEGETYGAELSAKWQPLNWINFQAAYSYLEIQLHLKQDGTQSPTAEDAEGNSPHHQVSMRTNMDLRENLELNLWLRYIDSLPNRNIDHYTTLDVRLGWRPLKNLEMALIGQNLLDDQHPEFTADYLDTESTEMERSFYGKITWEF
jgi:iron complex outermembrane receptor protein